MEGLRLWVTTLVEYDKYGNASVLRSFSKIARDSDVKQQQKKVVGGKKAMPKKSKAGEDKKLW